MAATRLRAALIGAGRRGTQQAATLSELPDLFDFAAVCDPSAAALQRAVERYACPGYASVPELFASEQLDVVVIATPPELHHVGVKAAAAHGVNVLVETPLALTRAMMDVLAEAAERAGIVVEVGENYGRRPAEVLNRSAVAAGLIGKPVHISVFNGPANQESAYHIVSLFRAYAGGADVGEDAGARNRMHCVESGEQRDCPMQVDARQDGNQSVAAMFSYAAARGLRVANPFPTLRTDVDPKSVCDGIGRAAELLSLHRAITENVLIEYGIAAGRRSQEVGLAIIEAARLRHPISSHLDDETPWESAEHQRFRAVYGADPIADVDELI